MKKTLFSILFLLLIPGIALSQTYPGAELDQPTFTPSQEYVKGRITDILDSSSHSDFGQETYIQKVQILLKSGENKGSSVTSTYETLHAEDTLTIGHTVILNKTIYPDGVSTYVISDVYRLGALWVLLGVFICIIFLTIGKYGTRAIIGLAVSFAILMLYLIPQILAGANPMLVAIISAIVIASSSLFIAHGFSIRTLLAFTSTMLTVAIAIILAQISVTWLNLRGLGTEEAFYLQFAGIEQISLQGLLLGGIIIGTLGVLDDITTSQTAAVEEIHKANTSFSYTELIKRGLNVGKEHSISLVNTLVLAYAGSSLPIILLFSIYEQPFWVILNSEIILEEIARMIIGSSALLIAVPLTTIIAAYVYSKKGSKIRKKLASIPGISTSSSTHYCKH